MTKAQRVMLDNYRRSTARTLDDIYGNYSANKARAFRDCEWRRKQREGFDARIPTHNQQVFTYAYQFVDLDGCICLHYETAVHQYDFCVEA